MHEMDFKRIELKKKKNHGKWQVEYKIIENSAYGNLKHRYENWMCSARLENCCVAQNHRIIEIK